MFIIKWVPMFITLWFLWTVVSKRRPSRFWNNEVMNKMTLYKQKPYFQIWNMNTTRCFIVWNYDHNLLPKAFHFGKLIKNRAMEHRPMFHLCKKVSRYFDVTISHRINMNKTVGMSIYDRLYLHLLKIIRNDTGWRQQMETLSALLALC